MFLVLLQLWQKGIFILVTCLPNWAWGSCKNTLGYCPLKMAFSHQKAKTETTPMVHSQKQMAQASCLHLFSFFLDIPFLRA